MAALVLFATAASQAPPAASLTAEQAMAQYRAMMSGVIAGKPVEPCPDGTNDQIIVCARHHGPPPRLPLPDQRAEEGEVVRHPGEPGKPDPGPPMTPSKLGETIGKGYHLLKSIFTGEDPVD